MWDINMSRGKPENLSYETIVNPGGVEIARVVRSQLSTQGTVILIGGEGTRNASKIPGVVDSVLADHRSVFVGALRTSRLTGASVGTIVEQVKAGDFPKPYLLTAHSAGGVLVLDWLREQGSGKDVSTLLLNPPLAASWSTRFFVTKGYRTLIPQIRRIWDCIYEGPHAANYNPWMRTYALEDVKRVQAEKFDEFFWQQNRGRLRIITNPRDLTVDIDKMRKIVPDYILRTWSEYGISRWTAPLFGHDPMPAFGIAFTAYKKDIGFGK